MVGDPNLAETRKEMDEMLADVMPDSWSGHARIAAFNESKDLSDKVTEIAVTVADSLAKKTDYPPDTIAKVAVEKAKERYA